jgi:fructokinase
MTTEKPVVVGLGELLWDEFGSSRRPGGAPANVAFHAGQCGCEGVVCSRVGRDEPGDGLIRFLAEEELDSRYIQRDPERPSGRVTVDASTPGHPQYVIHENVAWDNLEWTDALGELMARADAVCFGSLAQRSSVSRETVRQCLAATRPDCLRVFDVNLRQQWFDGPTIAASLNQAQVVKLNTSEVVEISRLLQLPGGHAEFASALHREYAVGLTCITRGEHGCLLVSASGEVEVSGLPVEVGDAVGAGDAFTAAMIYGLLRSWPLRSVAEFANRVGAMVASREGAMPPLRHEFEVLKSAMEPGTP